jgi:hypothetical protein
MELICACSSFPPARGVQSWSHPSQATGRVLPLPFVIAAACHTCRRCRSMCHFPSNLYCSAKDLALCSAKDIFSGGNFISIYHRPHTPGSATVFRRRPWRSVPTSFLEVGLKQLRSASSESDSDSTARSLIRPVLP